MFSCSVAKRSSFLFLPFSVQKVGVCNVLPTVYEGAFDRLFSGAKINRWVGDFQVATGGGFWVAAGGHIAARCHAGGRVLQKTRRSTAAKKDSHTDSYRQGIHAAAADQKIAGESARQDHDQKVWTGKVEKTAKVIRRALNNGHFCHFDRREKS